MLRLGNWSLILERNRLLQKAIYNMALKNTCFCQLCSSEAESVSCGSQAEVFFSKVYCLIQLLGTDILN